MAVASNQTDNFPTHTITVQDVRITFISYSVLGALSFS